jgi:DNA gyrase subunit A
MSREQLLSRLLEFIDSGAEANHLTREAVLADTGDWYREAIVTFGSWDQYLAATLVHLRRFYETQERRESDSSAAELIDDERPERKVGSASYNDAYVVAASGFAFVLQAAALHASTLPSLTRFPAGPHGGHTPESLVIADDDPGVCVFTSGGNGLAVDARLLPRYEPDAVVRPLNARFSGISSDETVVSVLPRRALRDMARFYFMTVQGQMKASDTSEYRKMSSEATVSTLTRDDDALLCVLAGASDAMLSVWSSLGKALVFDASEVRSQGRKATGVKAIALDPGARVVSAFVSAGRSSFVVLATAQGLFKRMRMSDFRPQGRAGNGLQTCRLNPGDEVSGVASIGLADDVVILTSRGRYTRFPVYDIPLMGRAAKGENLVPLEDGETVVSVQGLPAGVIAE